MIYISCKFYLRKLHDIYILHQFSWGHNRIQKVSSNMQRIAYSSSFIPCKNNRECGCHWFSPLTGTNVSCKIKKIITFCGCKPSQKTGLSLIKILLVLMKKAQRYWMNFKIHRISKGRKVNKVWHKLFDQNQVKFYNQACLREREAYNNKSNVLLQARHLC